MINRVVLVGRLTRDPEVRYTGSGVAVASMRIAVDRPFKNQQGEKETDFFDVVAWRQRAEYAQQYLTKGRLIGVDGRLQTRSYTTQDGQKRTAFEVVADNIQSYDRPREEGAPADDVFEEAFPPEEDFGPPPARPQPSAPTIPPPPTTSGRVARFDDDDFDMEDPFADQ